MTRGHGADRGDIRDAVNAPVVPNEVPKIRALVEMNCVHMDDADTTAIITALEELGVEVEATEQTTFLKAQWWVLTLRWIGDDLPHMGFDSLLTLLGHRVWQHYRKNEKAGPSRIDVYGENDEIVASHDVDREEADETYD